MALENFQFDLRVYFGITLDHLSGFCDEAWVIVKFICVSVIISFLFFVAQNFLTFLRMIDPLWELSSESIMSNKKETGGCLNLGR